MKNGKSPGIDGFTAEFYKFFWNDLNEYLIRSFNYSFEKGYFSISQTQGMLTCIPKEGKSKLYLKMETYYSFKCRFENSVSSSG